MIYDTVLRNAHVIDPSQSINRVLDVGISKGVIAGLGQSLTVSPGTIEMDLSGKYLCPGLIDLHGHWYEGSAYGIDPDRCLKSGVTSVVDAGTSGFVNFGDFRRNCIASRRIEVLAFINIAACGIPTAFVGELDDLRYARPKETIAILQENADVAVGVKLRAKEGHGQEALGYALEAAQSANLPLMVHISKGANTPEILRRLRPGDVLTHCFQGRGDGILQDGMLIPEAIGARNNGVVFDVGHGCGSFNWNTAKKAFEYFFYPDTISTDLHRYSVERWAIDMPTTMSKFLHLGMSLEDVILKSTWAPARVINRKEGQGTLRVGTVADIFVFTLDEGEFPLEDTHLKIETARRRIRPYSIFKTGEVIDLDLQVDPLRKLYDADYDIFRFIEQSA